MLGFSQCAALAGLGPNEIVLGVSPSARHRLLLASYLMNSSRGKAAVRQMIISDLRDFLDLGAVRQAADRFIVLRHLLSEEATGGHLLPPWHGSAVIEADGIRGWRPASNVTIAA